MRACTLTVARWRILRFPLFRVNPLISGFFQPTGCLCEVIHIRRVDGGAYRSHFFAQAFLTFFLFVDFSSFRSIPARGDF